MIQVQQILLLLFLLQIVIDAKDYKPDGINVKVVDDKVVVEGKIEKKEGNSVSTQTFVRRFTLPVEIVDFSRITSALSKDGVLKVIAPKLVSCDLSFDRK